MIYEYKCTDCGHIWEEFLKMSEWEQPILDACPKCAMMGYIERHHSSTPVMAMGTGVKLNQNFQDRLQAMKDSSPQNANMDIR